MADESVEGRYISAAIVLLFFFTFMLSILYMVCRDLKQAKRERRERGATHIFHELSTGGLTLGSGDSTIQRFLN